MRQLKLCAIVLLALLFSACATAIVQNFQSRFYTVQARDTLYSIAWRFDLNYRDIARWNNIVSPYRIYVGQKIRLNSGTQSASVEKSKPATKPKIKQQARTPQSTTPPSSWQWPIEGQVIKTFSVSDESKKGINISGTVGQKIVAAAAGEIVYSGSGLVGYGKLIIISHNKDYLSAYAHNRKMLVKEGNTVKKGQKIAELGSIGSEQPVLHFQIRVNGKPVNPLQYLPKR